VAAARALQALQALIVRKEVDYDYRYYKLRQHVDVPTTILSVGPSMFKAVTDVSIPLTPTHASVGGEPSVTLPCPRGPSVLFF
jgi:Mini-chromosome maintenance replisome factor